MNECFTSPESHYFMNNSKVRLESILRVPYHGFITEEKYQIIRERVVIEVEHQWEEFQNSKSLIYLVFTCDT